MRTPHFKCIFLLLLECLNIIDYLSLQNPTNITLTNKQSIMYSYLKVLTGLTFFLFLFHFFFHDIDNKDQIRDTSNNSESIIAHDPHPIKNALLEQLTHRHSNVIKPELCWHPDTDSKVIESFYKQHDGIPGNGLYPNGDNKYQLGARWSTTATNGSGLTQGDPTTLTWSFVPDGTGFAGGCGVPGESTDDSDLIAFLDTQFGSGPGATNLTMRPWFIHFQQVFDRWGELTGITYVYEDDDDGANFGGGGSLPGVLDVRGDVRIGGHRLDGNSGVLACNYFPNLGDMIFDTDDNFYNSNNILGFKNVISHEHGHGLGFAHSCPVNQSKLMEPFISIAFDGPQEDDILAGNRQYGDPNENNNTSTTAESLGTVSTGNILSEMMVSIDDDSENDYYSFTTTSTDDYNITVTPTGTTYLSGPQLNNGSCSAGTNFNALIESNIGIELLDTDGTTVLATSNAQAAGFEESICNYSLTAGTYFVRVFGDANTVQMYDIEIEQGTTTCAACNVIINEVDYDQGGTDDAEFIELYNPCGQSIDLSTYSIQLINGSNNNAYETINLSGTLTSGDYYVICTDASNTPNCDLDLTINSELIQDGAPDAIALFDGTVLTDVLSYEGNVTGFVEGTAVGLTDDGSTPSFGLSRIPNGTDTDNNDDDFSFTLVTPGEAGEDVGVPLTNPTMCQEGLIIPDNNCDQTNEFLILVNNIAGTQLGTDVEVQNVDLIIEHSWVADLDISLISPNGAEVILSSDNGGQDDNYGDPTDTSCQSVTSFDMSAGTSITAGTAPFIGSFMPEGDFATFNDGSDPNGLWILQVCDDENSDQGELEFVEIVFEITGNNNCPPSYSQANGNMLTGTQSVVADFETDGIIESDQIIDADVIYDSGTSIEMESGFEVFLGRVFEAFIDGCGNLFREDNNTSEKK